jgi:hypothetical protein
VSRKQSRYCKKVWRSAGRFFLQGMPRLPRSKTLWTIRYVSRTNRQSVCLSRSAAFDFGNVGPATKDLSFDSHESKHEAKDLPQTRQLVAGALLEDRRSTGGAVSPPPIAMFSYLVTEKRKTLPSPGLDSTSISPPWRWTIRLHVASPIPVPENSTSSG